MKSEIEAIRDTCDVLVIGQGSADLPYTHHAPYHILPDWDDIAETIEAFRPHVLHTHWLYNIWTVEYFAKKMRLPYTVRAHSFDMLIDPENHYPSAVPLINDDLCLGVLTFPFGRPALEKLGVHSDKLHDCYPVVHYRRFYDPSPNGQAIMNVGACLPKKQMEDFLALAPQVPDREFNLYALGYDAPKLLALNTEMAHPVRIIPAVEPEDMPGEYKKHQWLVYTASREIGTVGWPMSIAEAQASGVGICMANIRPDLRQYIGEAGFLYDSVSDVVDLISKPVPQEWREMGFEQAKKSDIFVHKTILTDLWRQAYPLPFACSETQSPA
jgi:hypothetical protein